MHTIGVARIFDWGGGPNHKSHAMTSSEIFKKGTFYSRYCIVEWNFFKDIVKWKI